ncbi:zf-CCHC domain-containing protein/DUF4219 domain-containing protein [Cephalotus follicularis]|uniref:Zf-CCHC domain-containing protein/DUF4219 domain-containing protein n=1 Tax=Cephalotus follicularis TaxID=3775 RepID=A0A1Q3BDT9_CEPFO|nr:zf-CCHC domain-containing protein/DUF4219 domain-containing protein [Cephalotus follicularis]
MATFSIVNDNVSHFVNMPPFFDGNNYNEWQVKMTSFIQSLDYDLWDIVVFGLEMPKETMSKTKIRYDEKEKEMLKLNARAKYIIFCALDSNMFNCISSGNSTKENWDKLEDMHKEKNVERTTTCLMALEESESESDEEDASKGENEVSYDDFVEVVDMYTLIISSLKNKIKCLNIENNELKMNIYSVNENESNKEEIGLLKREISCLSKENQSLKNEVDIINMSLELSTNFKKENEKLKIEVDAIKKMFSKFSSSSDKLDRLLGVQRCVFDKAGLGFGEMNKVKHVENLLDRKKTDNVVSCNFCDKNGHIASKCWNTKNVVSCNFCGKIGHISSVCWHKKYSMKVKEIWVPKGTIPTNLNGPKVIWVPNKST